MSALARHAHWVLILACCTLYGLAFAFPAVTPRQPPKPLFSDLPPKATEHFEAQTKTVIASGDLHDISGPEAFTLAWVLHSQSWWGNPALWLGTILLALRMWSCVPFVVLAGFVFAAEPASDQQSGREPNRVLGLGYWLWFGSIALLFAGSLAGWCRFVPREERRSPVEVFRGWRGVALGSWLAVGLTVVFVWWSARYFHPPVEWRNGVIGVWLTVGLGLFATKQLEADFSPRTLWGGAAVGTWLVFGLTAFVLWCFWPEVCPPPPPR